MTGVVADAPSPRPVPELLARIAELDAACTAMDDADAAGTLDEALTLLLELRVPRVPDDDASLAAILRAAEEGPSIPSNEAFAKLQAASDAFSAGLDRFRSLLAGGAAREAAAMLLPGGIVPWPVAPLVSEGDEGEPSVLRLPGAGEVRGSGRGPAARVLSAALGAHLGWPEVWDRRLPILRAAGLA